MMLRIWYNGQMNFTELPRQSMLCSGLLDKNGNMLFENDILQDITGHLDKVIFLDGCFQLESLNGGTMGLTDLRDIHHHLEVVGNTLEHSYLENTPLTL